MKTNYFVTALKIKSAFNLRFPLMMRISLALLFVAVIQLRAGNGYAQRTNEPIFMSGVPIEQVLNRIEETSDFVFLYSDKVVNVKRVVSVNNPQGNIVQILDDVFKGSKISYTIVDKQIILSASKQDAVSQDPSFNVKGIVKDALGEPLIGVNVVVKGASFGTITDIDGQFSLKVKKGDTVEFSYVGYASQAVTISDNKVLTVIMKEDTEMLGEVVVTAMGIQRLSKTLSYTAESVGGKELTRVKDANLINALQGKSAGLIITPNANGAGGSSKILLRGNKSIQGSNNPLIVIDGVPMANNRNDAGSVVYGGGTDQGDALSTLNPDDIESISVLKGASAAALYGTVAANGVIVLTTKKGREGKIKIDVSSNMTAETAYNLPELQNTYGTAINNKTGKPLTAYSWGEQMDINGFNQIKDFYQTGYNLNNSISVSGGSKNSQSYFSYGNTTSHGIVPTNQFMRHNLSANQSFSAFNGRLTMNFASTYTYSETKNKPVGGMLDNPLVGLYIIPRNVDYRYYRDNYELMSDPKRPSVPIQNWLVEDWGSLEEHSQNPYWMLNRGVGKSIRHRFTTSGTLKYQLLDCLSIQGRLSYERDNTIFRREKHATTYRLSMGAYSENVNFYEHIFGDALLNFNKKVGVFDLSAVVGGSFTLENTTGSYVNAEGDQYYEIDVTDANGTTYRLPQGNVYFPNVFHRDNYYDIYLKENNSKKRINSVFATFQVGYKDMIYLDVVTSRNDWSSALAFTKSMRFHYPSFGATFLLDEIFKMNKDVFNMVKLRSSYSIVGNDIPPYYSLPMPKLDKLTIQLPTLMPFTDWKPEKTYSFEIGFDLSLFQKRLQTEFTFYKANTKNQYFQVDAPVASGYAKRNINAGNVQNLGVEASIRYNFSFNNDWIWTPSVNFSYNKNEIKELYKGASEYNLASSDAFILKLKEGGSYGDVYTRDFQYDEKGNIKLDKNGTPLLTENIDTYAGNFNSKFRLGWSNSINWKNLSIYTLIDGKIGGKVLSMTEAIMDGYGVSKKTGEQRLNGGVANTDGSLIDTEKYYSIVGGRSQSAGFAAKEYMYSATNFRLRELSVGYTFERLFGSGINVTTSLVGRNLFFIYKKSPCDPDISGSTGNGWQGIDVFSLPTTRSWGLNLKFNF